MLQGFVQYFLRKMRDSVRGYPKNVFELFSRLLSENPVSETFLLHYFTKFRGPVRALEKSNGGFLEGGYFK